MERSGALFSETQRFRQWWVMLIVCLITTVSLWAFVEQIVLGKSFGTHPASNEWLVVIVVFGGVVLPGFILSLKLQTEVTRDAILVRLWPVHLSWLRIPIASVQEANAITYRPFREYGGWGVRYGAKGKAYSVSGDRGVALTYGEGRHLLIGSKRADELARAIAVAHGGN